LLEGVRAGLLLALLVGPVIVLLIQMSLRRGTLSAFAAAFGIWCSDAFFVLSTHFGMGGLAGVTEHTYFNEVVGTIGAAILVGSAAVMWFRDPPDLTEPRELPTKRGLISPFLQGFAINTFNPFTITFWSLFSLTQIHDRRLDEPAALAVYGGVLLAIILTDTVKVLAARKLRDFLQPRVILRLQRVGAVALAVFGVGLVLRVWW
jgi:threonine/homoserine/homoserine lactone efflux protein